MLLFVLTRELLQLSAARPALLPLFQLPPRYGSRFDVTALLLLVLSAEPAAQQAAYFHVHSSPKLVFFHRQIAQLFRQS